jgi:TRAP-type mannitol/chloroaromatic compound transport system substrate-binding protein
MKRRDFVKTAGGLGAVGALGAAFPTPAISQDRKEWRLQATWPRNAPLLWTGVEVIADYVAKASDGRLTIKLYGSGEIAPPFQTMDAVADGAVEMGHGYPSFWVGKMPALNFFAPVPFAVTTQEQNAWYRWGGGQELADKAYAEMGVKFFPGGNTSVQAAGWLNKEINSIGDFRGLKIRSGGLGSKVLSEVGATPVQIPLGEVPQALQSGAVDGADFVGPFNDMAFGLHKVAKFYYWPGWMEPCGVLDTFINLDAWNSLSDDLKEIVKGGCTVANAIVVDEFVAKNGQALKTMVEEHDVQIRMLNDETLTELGRVSNDVVQAAASADALSREVYDSLMSFRKMVLPYTNLTELAFMQARKLDFPYGA